MNWEYIKEDIMCWFWRVVVFFVFVVFVGSCSFAFGGKIYCSSKEVKRVYECTDCGQLIDPNRIYHGYGGAGGSFLGARQIPPTPPTDVLFTSKGYRLQLYGPISFKIGDHISIFYEKYDCDNDSICSWAYFDSYFRYRKIWSNDYKRYMCINEIGYCFAIRTMYKEK